ncbi:phosphopantetheine-binding protein [Planomonospora sp. ID91781]|uniref:Phosphopantetheine-binding protein n=1 Tax=Planomonospora sphaerica TaxID=161355 RepID=A0A171CRL7_9ACTN|nr:MULTISPECIES: phosphopantetheine-binding protein [Planomonospora]MBG0823416.1 phosphopantetheine-binding protein [Planomonospora sp. ID91781]GAT67110.1 phosphopantetheine-binding protein [Planomonospora sphaerica]
MTVDQHPGPVAPEIERRVERIWKDVLGVPEIPSDATFFELGGQSVSAVRIIARIEEELGVVIDMGDLFEDPDLVTFARDVAARAPGRQA